MNSWMIYGPFSLDSAIAADLSYKLWLNTESDWDLVCHYASTDGSHFSGYCFSGNSAGWIDQVLDLTSYASQSNVWVALQFQSDSSFNYLEGAHVDNILLRKCESGCTLASGPALPLPSGVVEYPVSLRLEK